MYILIKELRYLIILAYYINSSSCQKSLSLSLIYSVPRKLQWYLLDRRDAVQPPSVYYEVS